MHKRVATTAGMPPPVRKNARLVAADAGCEGCTKYEVEVGSTKKLCVPVHDNKKVPTVVCLGLTRDDTPRTRRAVC